MSRHALVLAAGQGTRFGRSDTPKVLQLLAGRPLLCHLLDKLFELQLDSILIVVGHGGDQVRKAVVDHPVRFVEQPEQLGTGHAVQVASEALGELEGSLLVLYGDAVLVSTEQLRLLCEARETHSADLTLLTGFLEDPAGYGRILRDGEGQLRGIVEERDADEAQRAITEVNPGFYCFAVASLLDTLPRLSNDNAKGEYYLTDLAALLLDAGGRVETLQAGVGEMLDGVNDRRQLARAEKLLRRAVNGALLERGVILIDPERTYVDPRTRVAAGTTIFPGAVIEGPTEIGPDCQIHANVHLSSATIGAGAVIDHGSVVRSSSVGDRTTVGPYAHLRSGCRIGADARIGNFVEIKNSTVGDGSKAAHLTYLGDAVVGERVNIGAGTITCNYDGSTKSVTTIDDGAFVGSNTQLIAPVRIGRNAYVAAGSTITEDVPDGALAIARSRQINKKDWKKE